MTNNLSKTLEGFRPFFKNSFHNTVLYLRALKFNVFILVMVIGVFLLTSQGVDLFNGMVADGFRSIAIFWLSITLLSILMWYSSIHFLIRYDLSGIIEGKFDQGSIVSKLPFLCGISTYLVVLLGFYGDDVVNNNIGVLFAIAGILIIYLISYLRSYVSKKMNIVYAEEYRDIIASNITKDAKWEFLSKVDKYIIVGLTIMVFVTMIFALSISFKEVKPISIPLIFSPSTIICSFLSGFLIFLLFLWSAAGYRLMKRILFGLLLLIAVFSIFNNNHQIRLVEQTTTEKESIEDNFLTWLQTNLDTTKFNEDRPFPIYLIAAEGGGIRSMKWTALVLNKLFESNPSFKNHTYAVSGVSGGSVGIAVHQASLKNCSTGCGDKLNAAVSKDFLSPVTFGMLFPDLMQSLIPFPIDEWDRSKWLEDSWLHSFKDAFNSENLNLSVSDYHNDPNNYIPNIFLNTTCLETGQKAIVSNLKLSENYFKNVIDLEEEISRGKDAGKGIPIKTGASMSARFPLVTSAGKIDLERGTINVVDGGYHDNTGLETIYQLINLILNSTDKSLLSRCKLSVIFIKNSATEESELVETKNFLVDLNAPLLTFFNNWNDRSNSTADIFEMTPKSFKKYGIATDFFKFELDRAVRVDASGKRVYKKEKGKEVVLPLGWYLSDASNTEISRQADLLTNPEFDKKKDPYAKANFDTFLDIKRQLD